MKMQIKPKLNKNIDANQSEYQNCECDQISNSPKLNRINSTKNVHQLKKIVLANPQKVAYERAAKLDKLRKLQRQKEQLMHSLQLLKNGAVNCIVQKDETIAKLKAILTNNTPQFSETKMEQVDKLLQYIRDLELEKNYLKQEIQQSRRQYERDFEEKDSIINELSHQLNRSITRIQGLQKYDVLLEEKIKILQQNNQNLSMMLNQSQQSLINQQRQLETSKDIQSSITNEAICINASQVSDIPANDLNHSYGGSFGRFSTNSLLQNIDQLLIQCKVQQLKKEHELELSDLTNFYESRIQALKQICNQQSEDEVFFNPVSQRRIQKIAEDISYRSGYSNIRDKQKQKTLTKNFSLGSLKSQETYVRMNPIDERQQLLSPRRSLKQEILYSQNSSPFFHKISKENLSESQADNKSCSESSCKFNYYQIPSQRKLMLMNKKKPDNLLWEKVVWFTIGTLAGGSILKVGQQLFK